MIRDHAVQWRKDMDLIMTQGGPYFPTGIVELQVEGLGFPIFVRAIDGGEA